MNRVENAIVEIEQCKNVTKNFVILKEMADHQLSYTQMGALIYILEQVSKNQPMYQAALIPIMFKLKVLMGIVGEDNEY